MGKHQNREVSPDEIRINKREVRGSRRDLRIVGDNWKEAGKSGHQPRNWVDFAKTNDVRFKRREDGDDLAPNDEWANDRQGVVLSIGPNRQILHTGSPLAGYRPKYHPSGYPVASPAPIFHYIDSSSRVLPTWSSSFSTKTPPPVGCWFCFDSRRRRVDKADEANALPSNDVLMLTVGSVSTECRSMPLTMATDVNAGRFPLYALSTAFGFSSVGLVPNSNYGFFLTLLSPLNFWGDSGHLVSVGS